MFTIISRKKWQALLADRDRLLRDVDMLYTQVSALSRAVKDIEKAHRALGEKVKEYQQSMAKLEKKSKKITIK